MPTRLLISPPASGKTQFAIDHLLATLRDRPLASLRVIVPDRLQMMHFRRRLAVTGGAIGIRIGTFSDFDRSILQTAHQPIPLATDPVIYRLLKAAVSSVATGQGLALFEPIASTPGFINILRDRFAELKRARVFPESLLDRDDQGDPGFMDLARIYFAYQNRLLELDWADPEGLSWLAVEALEKNPTLVPAIDLLVIDGFDSFNGAQLTAIRKLDTILPRILITLPGSARMERNAYRRFARSLNELRIVLPEASIEAPPVERHLQDSLGWLAENLFENAPIELTSTGRRLVFLETRTPADEAREALRWLKARIVRDDLHPEQCALIAPDPATYRPLLLETAAEFGLSLRFSDGAKLPAAPGIAALLDLLDLPLRNWERGITTEILHTPYFDLTPFGLSARQAGVLELVSQVGVVVDGLAQWEEALTRLSQMEEQPAGEDDEDVWMPVLPLGEAAVLLWQGLRAFATRLTPPVNQRLRDWITWLEDLLDDLRFHDLQETERDQAAARALRETLRALVLSEEITPGGALNYGEFIGELRSSLDGARYQEDASHRQPAVQVLRVLEARGLRYQAVAMLGLSEGLFPEVEREDPILRENVRKELGLEQRLGREQGGLFYQAVTRADRYLLLSRPTLAADGERWEPSPYWVATRALFSDGPTMIRPDDPRPLADAASPEELLFLAARRGSLPAGYRDLSPRVERIRLGREVLNARLMDPPASRFEGDLSQVRETFSDLYGPGMVWSASRLETYSQCPLMFYIRHTLNLEAVEPPGLGMDVAQLGRLLHAILEEVYQRVADPTDPDAVLGQLVPVANEKFTEAPDTYGFRPSPLWEMEKEEILQWLSATIRNLAGEGDGWTPRAYERKFGLGETPAMELETPAGVIRLAGVIDRMDKNITGELRVIDYKTGSGGLGRIDLIAGRRLQLPIYAQAAQDSLGFGKLVEGLYWAIRAAKAGSLRLSDFSYQDEDRSYHGPGGALDLVREHAGRVVNGVCSGRFPPLPPPGGCPSYCPAAGWCWRYHPQSW